MNPDDDFLLVLTESGLRQQMLKAINRYVDSQLEDGLTPKMIVDQIVTDLIIHGKYAGTIG